MTPQEVQALKQEVDSLISKNPKTQYEYFQQDLDALKLIADAAVKQGRALIFYVSD